MQDKIDKLLDAIRNESENEANPSPDRDELKNVHDTIKGHLLEHDPVQRNQQLSTTIQKAILRFEASHPDMTNALNEINNILNGLGI